MYRKISNSWLKHWDFIVLDAVMLQVAYIFSCIVRNGWGNPYDDPTGTLRKTQNTISIHWYSKSWLSKSAIIRSRLTKPFHRILGVDCFKFLRRQ